MVIRALLLGAIGLAVQIVLFREALVRAGGDELVLGGLLAGWLLAGAAGAGLGRWPRVRRDGMLLLGIVALGAAFVGGILAWREATGLAGTLPGERQGAFLFAAQALLWNGPAALATGWLFVRLPGRGDGGDRRAASLVGFEALGAAAAGIVLALPGVLSAIPAGDAIDTRHGRYEVVERGGETWLRIDGRDAWLLAGELPRASRTSLAALLLQVPRDARVLLAGDPDLLPSVLEHAPATVDLLLPDPALERLLREKGGEKLRAALDDSRVRVHRSGLRAWLRVGGGEHDAIWLGDADPDRAEASRAVSEEGFAHLAARLAPGGCVGLRLGAVDGVLGSAGMERVALLAAGSADAGLQPLLLADGTLLVGRTRKPWNLAPARLAEEAASRGVSPPLPQPAAWRELVTPSILEVWNRSLRGEEVDSLALLLTTEAVDPKSWTPFPPGLRHTDSFPRALAISARITEGHARGGRVRWLRGCASLGAWGWFAAGAGTLMLLSLAASRPARERAPAARTLASSSYAGAVGILLLFNVYQAETGVLFADLGWLSASFLVGFALGGRVPRLARTADFAMLAALLLLAAWSFLPLPPLLGATGCALALGAAVGSPVAAATSAFGLRWAWSLDLAAAAPGAFLAGLVFLPLLGAPAALLLLAGTKLVVLLVNRSSSGSPPPPLT